jgi:hypothetical protein
MSKIKVYKGTPTVGGVDGELVSSGTGISPVESGPIKVPTEGYAEGSWIQLAVRCDEGYVTIEEYSRYARLSIEDSTNVDKWQLAPGDEGSPGTPEEWGDPLDFDAPIDDTNTLFFARARVAHTEEPENDVTVSIAVNATIGAAEEGEEEVGEEEVGEEEVGEEEL